MSFFRSNEISKLTVYRKTCTSLQPFVRLLHLSSRMKLFLKENMKERCRWSLAILLGMGILTANRELELVHSVWGFLTELIPEVGNFFL